MHFFPSIPTRNQIDTTRKEKTVSFEKIFEICNDRIHAIFLFLSMLELIQMHYMSIIIGEGRNNFIVEWNMDRQQEPGEPDT